MRILAQINFSDIETAAGLGGADIRAGAQLGTIISSLTPYLFAGIGTILLLYLIYGGFSLMFAGGDQQKLQKGKTILTQAFTGFVIVFVSFWVVQILGLVLGLDDINNIFR